MACCRNCRGFIPDTVGNGFGIGKCKAFEQYNRVGEDEMQIMNRLIELGNHYNYSLFWGGTASRECNRYKEI